MCERVCVCAHSSICRLCIKYDFGYAWTRVDPHFFVVALLWIQILCNLTGLFIDFVRDEILSIYLIAFDSGHNCMSVSVCVWCPQSIKMHSVLRNRLPDTSIIIWVSHFMICVFSLKYHQKNRYKTEYQRRKLMHNVNFEQFGTLRSRNENKRPIILMIWANLFGCLFGNQHGKSVASIHLSCTHKIRNFCSFIYNHVQTVLIMRFCPFYVPSSRVSINNFFSPAKQFSKLIQFFPQNCLDDVKVEVFAC